MAGTTVVPNFLSQFVMSRSVLHEDPLAEYGASLMYLKLNFSPLEPKEAAAILSRVHKGLRHGLERRKSPAYVIGASTGLDFSYIDFVLFDRDTALAAIQEILPVLGVDGGCTIEWFAG